MVDMQTAFESAPKVSERSTLNSRLDRELSIRGIGPESAENKGNVMIPAIPDKPAVKPGKQAEFIESTKDTLTQLGIKHDAKASVKRTVLSFRENVPSEVNRRGQDQELLFYDFGDPEAMSEPAKNIGVPLVVFSHGGKIHPEVIASSGYLTMLQKHNPNMLLCAVDHRGSQSHDVKVDYGLDDRVADI
ncbi:MAG: hypothetical protein ACD_52C00002G0031 [uncultured bacterium]|uniref:Uncharacterized protein n=1 Tax=Candidatus Woesebacteria bacterium RIFCSPHIGHO2_12_FULL_41_24 TaxID=1802510 RepID=A0A1F8AQT0_9BACT|nr:MAG: hypothetical protein ACD_52C00002G0031 [uncultured bacterium]OGM13251.1 MAG: hypothetical protein A2W15_04985 [Candidatus Woesebacteria bacterium RBG_16_41_13]OGM30653.1 MAG: hypothetical protein A2873_00880 [Candidatus Woesebacteria bacterium RIFCSPHIGHO2_01_FULL_42_80]OGM35790.1 MAG: hypothetical protein A3D84_00760 [Candidatus Woesebacteria bacterium RIFCSPHIGHO2_02_FULL_42_20]OGM53849.1 MAG: hypothetical protein A3E44_05530 [Candidatus Woesebacteria bacterium RIFCSPHIGHO2_12_FULL_41